MQRNRNLLYRFWFAVSLAGYFWIFASRNTSLSNETLFKTCFVKNINQLPCPSCGSTRAVLSILNGNFQDAFIFNPLGFIVIFLLILVPLWIVKDWITRKKTFQNFYQKIECYLSNKRISLPFLGLIVLNWIWNINKGL